MNGRQQMVSALLEAATAINRGEDSGPILRLMVERLKAIPPVGAESVPDVVTGTPTPKRARPARAALATLPGLHSAEVIEGEATVVGVAPESLEADPEDARRQEAREIRNVVIDVFAHWRRVMEKPQAKITTERIAKIRSRLREGYTPADLKAAISGCANSPFHTGENDRQTRYDDLTLILRNGSKVEYFKELAHGVDIEEPTAAPKPVVTDDSLEWDRETERLTAVLKDLLRRGKTEEYATQVRSNREREASRIQ